MPCFDRHLLIQRHKDAWAEEKVAPAVSPQTQTTVSRIDTAHKVMASSLQSNVPKEVLIIASKLKDYIKTTSGLSTSTTVLDRLSDMVRIQCDRAAIRAKGQGRKTVMDRDFVA